MSDLKPQNREYLKSLLEARQVFLRDEVKRLLLDKHGSRGDIRRCEEELDWAEQAKTELEKP
jgi:hypothetical protein